MHKLNWGRIFVMLVGNIFLGLGIAVFKFSGLGNDPWSGMVMALADYIGIAYAHFLVILNIFVFILQILFGRKLIGLGTFVNALLIGYVVTFFYDSFVITIGLPELFWQQVLIVCIGVIISSFGVSMYQTSDVGVAPYDSMSLIMTERFPKIAYFWHRMGTDFFCVIMCFAFGGIVHLGTFVAAFGLGPFVHFFNIHFTNKILLILDNKTAKQKAY